jgi:urea transport system permease protein
VRKAEAIWFLLVLVLLVAAPFFFSASTLTILLIYAMLALSLGLVWGFGGILCFGQAAFYGLGAYTYAVAALNIGESTIPMVLAILLPALLAAVLGALMFYGRISDVYLGVITLVVTLIFFKFLNGAAGEAYKIGAARLGGYNGIPGFQTLNVPGMKDEYITGDALYAVVAVCLVLAWGLCRWLLASRFGRICVAIRENELRAQLLGYDVRLIKTVLFTVGGAIAGLAGAFYASWAEIITPNLFSLAQSAEIIIWVIVGGVGTLVGPILGAMLLALIKIQLGSQQTLNNLVVSGTILVLVVLLLPGGVLPAVGRVIKRMFGRGPVLTSQASGLRSTISRTDSPSSASLGATSHTASAAPALSKRLRRSHRA